VVDPAALEREFCRIPGVTATRVVLDDSGVPREIHILATPAKPAKQVVRDVQSVAMATFNLELDRRIVSVVQLDSAHGLGSTRTVELDVDEEAERALHEAEGRAGPAVLSGEDLAGGPPRVGLSGVSVGRDGYRTTVEVTLSWRGIKAVGWEAGSAGHVAVQRQVAQATLAALRQLNPAAERLDVETATVSRVGDRDVAATTLVLLSPPHEEVLAGTAVVGATGAPDAIARAVLDAVNRRLGVLHQPSR
jgi:hypothetical protein